MGDVIELRRSKRFTLKGAREILPIIHKITQDAVNEVEAIRRLIEALDPDPEQRAYYEEQLKQVVERWTTKVAKLGTEPKGFWLVDFDTGEGYLCWRFPEDTLDHYHTYEGGFTTRTPIL